MTDPSENKACVVSVMEREDLPRVLEVERASYPDPWPLQAFVSELDNRISTALVAREGDQIVAHLIYWKVADELSVLNVAVHPSHRRRRLAEHLMRIALEDGITNGIRLYLLEVRASNLAARALYEKLGFRARGVRKRYYDDNGEDAVLMDLEVGSTGR